MRRLLLVLLILSRSPSAAGPPDPPWLTLRIYPRVALAPATIHVTLRALPHPHNRALTLSFDSESLFRSSTWPLSGSHAPAVFEVWWRDLPCGNYLASATLTRTDTHITIDQAFLVAGNGC